MFGMLGSDERSWAEKVIPQIWPPLGHPVRWQGKKGVIFWNFFYKKKVIFYKNFCKKGVFFTKVFVKNALFFVKSIDFFVKNFKNENKDFKSWKIKNKNFLKMKSPSKVPEVFYSQMAMQISIKTEKNFFLQKFFVKNLQKNLLFLQKNFVNYFYKKFS